MSDRDVMYVLCVIVNASWLTLEEKEYFLNALYFHVCNHHPHAMAADVIENILNEWTHLRYPSWRGRHGNWVSLQQVLEVA